MFHNCGKSCKITALVVFWLLAGGSALTGIIMLLSGIDGDEALLLIGAGIIVGGFIFAWLSSIALYTIGDIWERLHKEEQLQSAGLMQQEYAPRNMQQDFIPQEATKPDFSEQLRELKGKLEFGEITEEEFTHKKQEILDQMI